LNRIQRLLQSIFLWDILIGMKSTLRHLFTPSITLQYPHEKRVLEPNYRGMIALLRYDDGTEKCVGCDLCEAACPSRVITVISAEIEGEPMKRWAKEYYMDMTRCVFCGLCVKACPVDALGMTTEYEYATYDKRNLLLDKRQLLELGDRNYPVREKRIEFQNQHAATFNVACKDYPAKLADDLALEQKTMVQRDT
jgi:NADH-quinone oxidoreductase subunit I